MSDLADQPRIADAWPAIQEMLKDRHIIIFGADWARSALRSVAQTHLLDDAFCLHNKAKEYYHEFYDLSLEKILACQSIDKRREQLTDSRERILMLAQVVRNFAIGMVKQVQGPESTGSILDGMGDLDFHPF